MKILLDENIDVRFKKLFDNSDYEVLTVRDMQWNGIKNGVLLRLLKENGFACWIVVDKNIPYQQNISNLPCSIIVLEYTATCCPAFPFCVNCFGKHFRKQCDCHF